MRAAITWSLAVPGLAYVGYAYAMMESRGLLLEAVASALLSLAGVLFIIQTAQRRLDRRGAE